VYLLRVNCFSYQSALFIFIYFIHFGLFVVCFVFTINLLNIFTLFYLRSSGKISFFHLCKLCTVFCVPHLSHFLTLSTTLTNHDEPISKMRAYRLMATCLFPGNVPLFATTVIINLSSTQTPVISPSMINGVGVRGKRMCKLTK